MGCAAGKRFFAAVVTGGLSEIFRTIEERLTPAQKAKYDACDRELQELERKRAELERNIMATQQGAVQETVNDFTGQEEQMFQAHLALVDQLPDIPKTEKRSAAFMGRTSVGKSTLINTLFDTDCEVSPVACTQGVHAVHSNDRIEVFDVFGHNDSESYHNAKTLMVGKTLHIIVIVYNNCVEDCLRLARLTTALKVDAIFFRNNFQELNAAEEREVYDVELPRLKAIDPKFDLIVGNAKTRRGVDALLRVLNR